MFWNTARLSEFQVTGSRYEDLTLLRFYAWYEDLTLLRFYARIVEWEISEPHETCSKYKYELKQLRTIWEKKLPMERCTFEKSG